MVRALVTTNDHSPAANCVPEMNLVGVGVVKGGEATPPCGLPVNRTPSKLVTAGENWPSQYVSFPDVTPTTLQAVVPSSASYLRVGLLTRKHLVALYEVVAHSPNHAKWRIHDRQTSEQTNHSVRIGCTSSRLTRSGRALRRASANFTKIASPDTAVVAFTDTDEFEFAPACFGWWRTKPCDNANGERFHANARSPRSSTSARVSSIATVFFIVDRWFNRRATCWHK